jgi:hypothetical protein
MKMVVKFAALGIVALLGSGCGTFDKLHSDAMADRTANPEKYQEIPGVRLAQITPNQDGPIYQDSCAFGCPGNVPEQDKLASGN